VYKLFLWNIASMAVQVDLGIFC